MVVLCGSVVRPRTTEEDIVPEEFEAPDVQEPDHPAAEDAPAEAGSATEDRFTDLDLTQQPEGGYTPEWLQERYSQMQADYTRKTQQLAETRKTYEGDMELVNALRNDPEAQTSVVYEILNAREDVRETLFRDLANALGYDLEDFESDDSLNNEPAENEDDLSLDLRDPRVDELLQEREQQRQAQEWDTFVRQVEEHQKTELSAIEKEAGYKLSDEEKDALVSIAVSQMQEGQQDPPDYRGAWNHMKRLEANFQNRWLESKKASQVGAGQAGSRETNFNDDNERRRATAAFIEAQLAQQNT